MHQRTSAQPLSNLFLSCLMPVRAYKRIRDPRNVRLQRVLYAHRGNTAEPKVAQSSSLWGILGAALAGSILVCSQAESAQPTRASKHAIMLPVRQAEAVRGESAVLAVDSLDITLPKDDSQSLRDSFEQAAIRQMATVQQTYKTWAQQS